MGTTFRIYLPAYEGDVPQHAKAKKKIPMESGRVLLMDDNEAVLNIVSKMLSQLGYDVETARDGYEALDKYLASREMQNPFDVIILDLVIPAGMGGKETMARLMEIDPNVKVIVSSGYSNDPILANYKEYGFSGAAPKPFKIDELAELIRVVIAG